MDVVVDETGDKRAPIRLNDNGIPYGPHIFADVENQGAEAEDIADPFVFGRIDVRILDQ